MAFHVYAYPHVRDLFVRKYCAATLLALGSGLFSPALSAETLTLGRAALMAAKNHPDIRVSQAAIDSALASREIASDPFFPSFSLSSGFSYSEAQSSAAGGQNVIRVGYTRQYRIGLNYSQTLLDFGKANSAVEVQDKQLQASRYDLQQKISDVMLNVGTQYLTVLRDQQDVLINEDNVRNAQAQLVQAQGFYSAGTKAKIEVTQAEANVATAQIALVQAINAEKKARGNLNTSMGNKTFEEYTLREVIVSAPSITQEKALAIAEEMRPDLLAQRLRIRAAEAQVVNSQAQYWPTVSASAGYSWADSYFLPRPYNWNVGLTVSMPIFNEPLLGGQVRSSQAALRSSQASYDSLRLTDREAVLEAYISLREAEERTRLTLPALANAQENFRLATERYAVGVGSSLDVSDAQRLLVAARSQELQARFDLQLAVVKLHHEVGDLTLDLMLSAYPVGDLPSASIPIKKAEPPVTPSSVAPNPAPLVVPTPAPAKNIGPSPVH